MNLSLTNFIVYTGGRDVTEDVLQEDRLLELSIWLQDGDATNEGDQAAGEAVRWLIRNRRRPMRSGPEMYDWCGATASPSNRSYLPTPLWTRLRGGERPDSGVWRVYVSAEDAVQDFIAAYRQLWEEGRLDEIETL